MEWLIRVKDAVWGAPTLLLIMVTGVILCLRTRFFQIRHLKAALTVPFKRQKGKKDGMTARGAASAALSATMGTGNIVGVAGAVALGGPGAVFWMWVSSLFSMIVKFAEIVLAVRYRERTADGTFSGGAMYYIKNALPKAFSPLAVIFALCGTVAAFGIGNLTQINTCVSAVCSMAGEVANVGAETAVCIKLTTGVFFAVLAAAVLRNDGSVGSFCEKIIPVITVVYFAMTVGVVAVNYRELPRVLGQIITGAFSPRAVTGGAVASVFTAMSIGMSRGIFSNEAGLGTAPVAYACCDGDEIQLGLFGVFEVFVDTVAVCTLTALTVLCAGDISYGTDTAATLTLTALINVYGRKIIFVFAPIICFFAFSSIVGWGLYGARFAAFLFGDNAKRIFCMLFSAACVAGALMRADAVWLVSEILNGLMALPNIFAILMLSGDVTKAVREYEKTDR